MTAVATFTPVVKVGGAALNAEWLDALVGMRIERSLGVIGRATLRFNDVGFSRSAAGKFTIGQSVAIDQHGGKQLFTGTVTGVSLEQSVTEQPQLVVMADDDAYKLTLGTRVQTFLKVTFSDVVKKAVATAGMSADVASDGGPVHEYLLQAGSGMTLINDIAARIGFVWWVDDGTFHFKPAGTSTATTDAELGVALTEFSVRASGLRPTAVKVTGWDSARQTNIVGVASTSSPWTGQPQFVQSYLKPSTALGSAALATPDPSPGSQDEATAAASALFGDSLSASVVASGTCFVDHRIKPATTVKVINAGPASGNYLVTSVQHVYRRDGFTTRFIAGSNRPSGLVDTLGNPAPDPGFAVNGLVIATVTNNKDPDDLGRVKVRFDGIDGQVESAWARIITSSGGKDRGVVFMPEVKDEVLVGFEHNDARRPVVLGCLFSKVNKLPEAQKLVGAGGTVDYRRITSRKGHVIEFADGQDPTTQHILLKLGTAAHTLRIGGDEATLEVAAGKPLTIKAGSAKFAISSSGDVTIEGTNITIKATAKLQLEGMQGDVKATSQLNVQGGMVAVKANGVASVEASGPLTLKGAMVAIN